MTKRSLLAIPFALAALSLVYAVPALASPSAGYVCYRYQYTIYCHWQYTAVHTMSGIAGIRTYPHLTTNSAPTTLTSAAHTAGLSASHRSTMHAKSHSRSKRVSQRNFGYTVRQVISSFPTSGSNAGGQPLADVLGIGLLVGLVGLFAFRRRR
ncbi:MAG TPA: hypothetical protein VFA78_02840 [Chloroflexota bacterium]|nr:hypothetical protein [Chloroflexota bacterium]